MYWNQKQQSRYCTFFELGYHPSGTMCLLGYIQNVFQINISQTDYGYKFSLSYY